MIIRTQSNFLVQLFSILCPDQHLLETLYLLQKLSESCNIAFRNVTMHLLAQ